MPILVAFHKSPKKNKRYRIVLKNPDKIIDFGLDTGSTYIDHGDKKKRSAYLKRHQKNEDWTKPNPGSAAAFVLWGFDTDIKKNLETYLQEMGGEIADGAKISI